MDHNEIWKLFSPLYDDIREDEEFFAKKPLLAHYTSLHVLEQILDRNEIWFSHPLLMNDLEEVKFGVLNGVNRIKNNEKVRDALKTEQRYRLFSNALDHCLEHYEQEYLFDTYVFCLSEHIKGDEDGLLSMWRGYGGNGNGAALVFDTSKLIATEGSPIIAARVHYGSSAERFQWFEEIAIKIATILDSIEIPDNEIYLASWAIFERVKLFALFSKHSGFREEKEWRVVYMSERDSDGKLTHMLHYLNGDRGVEPKLRFKLEPIEGVTSSDFSLKNLLDCILLGPTTSSPMAIRSISRMLDLIGKPEFKDRLKASSIPLRPI